MAEYFKIETKYGVASICPTEASHIYFDANHNSGSDEKVGLTVRGVRYGASLNLHRWKDGAFHLGTEGKPGGVYSSELYITRAGQWNKEVSIPARKSIIEEVERAVNAWVAENPGKLDFAELANVERELDSKYEDLKKAKAEVDKLLGEIAELQCKRADAQKAVSA